MKTAVTKDAEVFQDSDSRYREVVPCNQRVTKDAEVFQDSDSISVATFTKEFTVTKDAEVFQDSDSVPLVTDVTPHMGDKRCGGLSRLRRPHWY